MTCMQRFRSSEVIKRPFSHCNIFIYHIFTSFDEFVRKLEYIFGIQSKGIRVSKIYIYFFCILFYFEHRAPYDTTAGAPHAGLPWIFPGNSSRVENVEVNQHECHESNMSLLPDVD